MPFDGLPQGLLSDMAKLRVALDGVRGNWTPGAVGKGLPDHCAVGWLLVATDWDSEEATRLALDYVYPALPPRARKRDRIWSIVNYNDDGGQRRIERLFSDAVKLAEAKVVC